MSGGLSLSFSPPGPVSAAFMADRSYIAGIMGPIGSAKTSTALMKILAHAVEQPEHRGVRYSRFAVIRDTYRRMGATTLRSWHKRVPRDFGKFSDGGMNAPSIHHLRFLINDRSTVDCEVMFSAVGDADVEDFCRGFEVTGGYLNEADLLAPELLVHFPGRCGRYPDNTMGGCVWRGLWLDFNAPDTESHLYRDFVEAPKPGYRLFIQPSGLGANAENVENLPGGAEYYRVEASGKPDWWVRRFVLNQWGYSREGKPVYPEWNDVLHVSARDLEPIPGVPLVIGADAGLTPAATIGQQTAAGQWRVLDELVHEGGAIGFSDRLNALLGSRYPGFDAVGWCDPAAAARASTDERSWLDIVRARTKLRWEKAPSNALSARLEAVRLPLTRLIDGQPGFLLSPRCKVVRKGFNAGYRFKRIRAGGGDHFTDEPEKNAFSHPHDAVQYMCLGGGGYGALLGRDRARAAAHAAGTPNDYDPFTW
ncbi:hypothetical protein AZL_025490 [Azospirillum sp. B510]|uniref:hypothetical protein n=1 Tax=Azospirillum sp. (strain B510) TaxID=137722 RepID=UPI0001C4CBF3|nr:hypothetical protein [Azospirillum sp. B510]BAI73187.1 hypothetical protein AZL_025490 [Azospirillum sp. B510]